ncbi:hypothetical protein B0T22DRAFT_385624 [Podospora appendiculata]|uniref:Uncharacterized protein n=1 Tax=Podospora appendiculata TaxID=314037 RepID=A0AAE1C8M9_9PEZI|nr:hypothetical protein B0T22DRAFT_385624 [Podospora appendiculata]
MRYRALGQEYSDDEGPDEGSSSPFSAGYVSSSSLSPTQASTSISTSTSRYRRITAPRTPAMAIASPTSSSSTSTYMTQHTFTPLSMAGSDYYLSENTEEEGTGGGGVDAPGWRSPVAGRLDGSRPSSRSNNTSTRPRTPQLEAGSATAPPTTAPAPRRATIVNAMVQSFEALSSAQSASTKAGKGLDLTIPIKNVNGLNNGDRGVGLQSPPLSSNPPSPARPQLQSQLHSTEEEPGGGAKGNNTRNSAFPRSAQTVASPTRPGQAAWNTSSSPTAGLRRDTDTTIIRPAPTPHPQLPPGDRRSQPLSPLAPLSPPSTAPTQSDIVRTSSTASLTINHPTPDVNKRSISGVFLGNIAALEATAERLSMTSSIEEAIRDEHNELKRSDSRRSSILQASSPNSRNASGPLDSPSFLGHAQLSVTSRQSSIVSTNNAARFGGYSPGGYIMSPHHSLSAASARLRLTTGDLQSLDAAPMDSPWRSEAGTGEDFPFVNRHGPGKNSTRSTASKLSLAQIAEMDNPTGLTQEAFDEADRAAAAGETIPDDDDTIRATAHQHIEDCFADQMDDVNLETPEEGAEASQPMLDHDYMDQPPPRLQLHQPGEHHYGQYHEEERPATSGSGATFEQAQMAFGDFDGVHCDPEADSVPPSQGLSRQTGQEPPQAQKPRPPLKPRPKSYFDPSTGQQMLFYPAPVPAMLNLPPKLSKKPKAAVRNIRRSQVLSAMPEVARDSRVWLPDPTEGLHGSRDSLPFMTGALGDDLGSTPPDPDSTPQLPQGDGVGLPPADSAHARHPSETSTIHAPPPRQQEREFRRPQRLTDTDKRKSRATMSELPAQLRASAFFDLPSTTPNVELKGGSAMATLDSILDASATAPVSAFIDHAFAGKLGSEVYGRERKKKTKKPAPRPEGLDGQDGEALREFGLPADKTIVKKSSSSLLDPIQVPKKRASYMSLLGGRRAKDDDDDFDEGRTTLGRVGARRSSTSSHEDASPRADQGPFSPNQLEPDSDESPDDEEDDEERDEDNLGYHGPPTTLLAELQLRKQQNKLRTRATMDAYPHGMHSTLLQLDAVAELERKARKGKRVNLAWEDPKTNPDHLDEVDDEDVPLGMLFVAKAAGAANGGNGANRSTMDFNAVMSEMNRPLGLMERREMEDNEPLSRRRDRIQGRSNDQLPTSLTMMQKRITGLTLAGALGATRSQSRLALPLQSTAGSSAGSVMGGAVDELEGETLVARRARLAAENPLPRARPVSGLFSSELLSQFGGDDERPDSADKGKSKLDSSTDTGDKENAPPTNAVPEEEETLGQRRRRLQAEREAREREIGNAARTGSNLGLAPDGQRLVRTLSMADVLGAHPFDTAQGAIDPREGERLRREAELARVQRESEAKMAAVRAQMPANLATPVHGARNGGYMAGRFNDGWGGNQAMPSPGYAGGGMPQPQQLLQQPMAPAVQAGGFNTNAYNYPATATAGVGPYGPVVPGAAYNMNPSAMNLNAAAYGAYAAAMGMPVPNTPQAHADMVERWRRSVMP